jgi:hypothetical protein
MDGNRSLTFGKVILVALGLGPVGLLPSGMVPPGLIPAGIVSSGISRAGLTLSANAQTRDPIVTSDTPEYCGILLERITGIRRATATPPPTEVAALSEEGERMCVHGQSRGGVMRLRRALEIMRHGED